MGRAGGLSVVVLLTLGVAGCAHGPTIRMQDVQEQIAASLAKDVGGAFSVSCPSSAPAESGFAFTCTVTDGTGGARITVRVVEDDDQGAFSWRVVDLSRPSGSAPAD